MAQLDLDGNEKPCCTQDGFKQIKCPSAYIITAWQSDRAFRVLCQSRRQLHSVLLNL